jgi:hypothetical protein
LPGRLSAAQTYCNMGGALQVLLPFVFLQFWNPTMKSHTAEDFSGTYLSTNILFLSSNEPAV